MSYAAKPAPYEAKPTEANNPLGTVALVLGIIGLFAGCPISLAAMITGWMGMKKEPSGMARVGFWLGTVATILQVVVLVIAFLFFGAFLGMGLTAVEMQPAPRAPVQVEMEAAPPLEVHMEDAPGIDDGSHGHEAVEEPGIDDGSHGEEAVAEPSVEVAPAAP